MAEFDLAAAVQEDAEPDQVGVRRDLGGDFVLGPCAGSGGGCDVVWDAASGESLRTLTTHHWGVELVAWSPNGRQLATGSSDKTALIWDTASWELVRTLTGHRSFVRSVAWSPDGRQLATFSWDDTAWVWDAASGKMLRNLIGHDGRVHSVAQPVPAIEEKPRESLHVPLPKLTQFDSTASDAMRHAASMPRPGEAIDTRMILLAVARVHVRGRRDLIWLYCAHSPDDIASQQNARDPKVTPREAYDGMELTATCADGLRSAARIANRYDLPIAPGILILGVLTDPTSGAARALGVRTTIEHGDLMRLVAEELLGIDEI